MKKNFRLHTFAAVSALFVLASAAFVSCGSDDDFYEMPENLIMLNMMNESHGKTVLGESGVYINNANNFTSETASIADLGMRGGYFQTPALTQLAREIAVSPGSFYQVFDEGLKSFASGKRAVRVGGTYYNIYVSDWISDDNTGRHIGAKVSYNTLNADRGQLPEWDYTAGTLLVLDANTLIPVKDEVSYTFPAGSEINVDYNGNESHILISVEGSKVTATLTTNYPRQSCVAYVYVRENGVYTRTQFEVKCVREV